ncbi:MAG: efflux RND transporter periplasmic adaptor subunit [Candidatus Pacebacteria bacterium]|nr:efflux RND transporter periplasmic adaptor subunit [Candidatus Paceibacterota bacterium]
MKRQILIIGAVIVLVVFVYQVFLKEKKPEFNLVEVTLGTVSQEIFETGQVEKGEKLSLNFGNTGKIEKIYVAVGDEVQAGQELAILDTADINIQLQEARAAYEIAQLNLTKLLEGASTEEVKISQAQLNNAQIAFKNSQDDLQQSFQTAMTVLDSSYPSIYNALVFVKQFVISYVGTFDSDAGKIMIARDTIESVEKATESNLDALAANPTNENIKASLAIMKDYLEKTFLHLETIRSVVDTAPVYKSKVSAADRASLDTLKTNINTALASIITNQQAIYSAEAGVETMRASLQEAENNFDLVAGDPKQVDVDLYSTQVKQALTKVQLYQNEIEQSKIISPVEGKIAEINKNEGESAQAGSQEAVIVLLPTASYEIKVDIYEEDVVKIAVGNSVDISLVAFSGKTFTGKIILISPAEKIVDGVVYYETIIGFEDTPEGIRSGMSADIVIKAQTKDNVLILPEDAIRTRDSRDFVEILVDGNVQEKDIEVGLKGSNDMVEIVSGLEQGEKVILR